MVQISKIKLDKDLERQIFDQFWYYLGKINNFQKSSEFFTDFLSETEKLIFAKRFAVAILITRGKTAIEIKNTIHVSNSTILNTSSWIKNAKPETQKLLHKISNEKSWEAVFDKIDDLLDKIPPPRHSDWKEEYKKKQERMNQRLIRKELR